MTTDEIAAIERYALGHGTLKGAPAINHETLAAKGFDAAALAAIEGALASAFDIKFAFNKWTLGESFCTEQLGIAPAALADPGFDLLAALGFTQGRDRGGQHLLLRRDDAGRRAAPQARASAGVRLRQPVRPATASAACRSTATSA